MKTENYWSMIRRVQGQTIFGDERLDPLSCALGDGPDGTRAIKDKEARLRSCLDLAMIHSVTPERMAYIIANSKTVE